MKDMKELVVLPSFALMLFACTEPNFKGVCEENGLRRACNAEEQNMIHAVNKIIDRVKLFDPTSLHSDFIQVSNDEDPPLKIFGENHLATWGKIETLGAINSQAKEGDILLLEGADRSQSLDFESCGGYLLYRIYVNWEYLRTHSGYDAEEIAEFIKARDFLGIYKRTRLSYDLSGLGIRHLQCFFWDHEPSLLEEKITPANMKRRNSSMVESIKEEIEKGHHVFVNTGYGHMPLGENIKTSLAKMTNKYEEHQAEMRDFYARAKKERKLPQIKRVGITSGHAASSRVLHKFLENIPHGQFIHYRMLVRPYEF